MGKGDWRRPMDKEKFDQNFDAIFGKRELKLWNPEELVDEESGDNESKPSVDPEREDRVPRHGATKPHNPIEGGQVGEDPEDTSESSG